MSLRTKILLPFLVTGLVLLIFLNGYWKPRHLANLENQYQESTKRHIASVVESLIPLMLAHQLDAIYENLDNLKHRNTNWSSIRLLAPDGSTIYPLVPLPAVVSDKDIHTVDQPIHYLNADLGRLIVRVDFNEPLKDMKAQYQQLSAVTIGIILFLIGVLWFIVEKQVSKPVIFLARASQKFANGDFDVALPATGNDEVGKLVESFSHMRSSIGEYQAELVEKTASLITLSRAVEQSPVSIIIMDCKGRIEFINPRFANVTGYGSSEVMGKNIELVKSRSDSAIDFGSVWKIISSGKVWNGEFQGARKNGEVFWASASLSPVHGEKGDIAHSVLVMEDISARRTLEGQLRQAQKMEAVGLLAGGIAHDFNNILSVIIGHGSMVLERMLPDDPLRPQIEAIYNAGERAAALTRSLLAFSRKQVIDPRTIEIDELVNQMKKLLVRIIHEDIELKTVFHRAPLNVFIDPGQLEQALVNLVTNACDAMPKGGTLIIETSRVTLGDEFRRKHGYGSSGEQVLISVSDTGTGMDKKTMERIYEPFFTTKEPGRGTGLGLSIVYGIVKQNTGYITCQSEPGRGTTFNIYFPLVKPQGDAVPAELLTAIPRGSGTILLAEDNEAVRKFVRGVLEEAGYSVILAVNGEDAVKKFQEHNGAIDLLLFDVIMPRKSGIDAYEELLVIRPDIKAIFTSGYTADLVNEKGVFNKKLNFIPKPCSSRVLLKKICDVLAAPLKTDEGIDE